MELSRLRIGTCGIGVGQNWVVGTHRVLQELIKSFFMGTLVDGSSMG